MSQSRVNTFNTVGGCSGDKNVANMWSEHYTDLLNCIDNDAHRAFVESSGHYSIRPWHVCDGGRSRTDNTPT